MYDKLTVASVPNWPLSVQLCLNYTGMQQTDRQDHLTFDKKLSYRRGTARCVVSVEILPIATQQSSTTSPEQIEVMKLGG